MKRFWLRSIIRMLNTCEEQLAELQLHPYLPRSAGLIDARKNLKLAIRQLNEIFDDWQLMEDGYQ